MCAIVDANVLPELFNSGVSTPSAGEKFREALEQGKQRLVTGGKLTRELFMNTKFEIWAREARRSGALKIIDNKDIAPEEDRLHREKLCKSDDQHILALAIVSGARLLYSNDQLLHQDFKNTDLIKHIGSGKARIYSTTENKDFDNDKHRRLLRENKCPA